MIDTHGVMGYPLPADTDFVHAAIDMLSRTGAFETQIRFSDDYRPVVWVAVAGWKVRGGTNGFHKVWRTSAALNPDDAVYALMELALDGTYCTDCGGVVQIERNPDVVGVLEMSCVYAFHPELKVFLRSCEGGT